MANDIGGGSRGEGGPLGDAAPLSIPNPNAGREQVDYGSRDRTTKPFTPTGLESDPVNIPPTAQYSPNIELDDSILSFAFTVIDGVAVADDENNIVIAKPPELRKTFFDDSENGTVLPTNPGEAITQYLGFGRRKISRLLDGGILERFEIIDPPYSNGSPIYASRSNTTGVGGVELQDLNVSSRKWINEAPARLRFIIKEIKKDYFNCYQYVEGEEIVTEEFIKVAKPHETRGTYWDDLEWNDGTGDITYADSSGDTDWTTRQATRTGGPPDTEDQIILPPWLVDNTVLTTMRMDGGTGVAEVLWQSISAGSFSEAFV